MRIYGIYNIYNYFEDSTTPIPIIPQWRPQSPHWGQGLHHSGLLGIWIFFGVDVWKNLRKKQWVLHVFTCFYMFLPCKFGKNAWQGISFSEKHVGCEQIQLKWACGRVCATDTFQVNMRTSYWLHQQVPPRLHSYCRFVEQIQNCLSHAHFTAC